SQQERSQVEINCLQNELDTLSSCLSRQDIEFTELQFQYTNLQGQYSRFQLKVKHLEHNSDIQYVQDLQQEINRLR
ncbi:3149_t:CDS:1, partial [Funneliformis geosporum]